uniref:Uncharacterized protein n=1 Tax=Cryptomonas curvata TaxID=233186 RepID=A0A7S0MX73_9CRYP|mmetsp:Transcript_5668/g.12576  ORF Transcript_5668/g.12576 Transcript_5668/m.12576 type:complete len:113 (+) Transcript_5668:606-944(+)
MLPANEVGLLGNERSLNLHVQNIQSACCLILLHLLSFTFNAMRLFDYAATIRIKICRKLSECNNLPTDKASPRIKVYQNTFGTKLVYAYLEVRNQNYVQEYFCGLHLSSVVP